METPTTHGESCNLCPSTVLPVVFILRIEYRNVNIFGLHVSIMSKYDCPLFMSTQSLHKHTYI